ncbi:30S ribosomal protein S15 [candidate division WWE3 bacterium CG_4_9_14_3_um_filter_41_6]|uniref:Small ribosomal subunit protein uS15 n=1 Tax=candidate division WWE3 bacterium CG_4_10_14_0_2_um_filter_41_14 TaxID=1975072 RepID=A0A2M7TLQ7_UNCKA|nr:MAG: 30S ribosomal protein S15 [candidate division WWE3 bacterium CG_4_10_14_0_2_um_filter_41_14]PJA38352.1 MAG: 30S ribosomal protein S15 [candidate division WWE3 bacterium CG_4_9_14_3_um_filter_41_6]
MALSTVEKQSIITDYKTHDVDTGSPEVQVALLTEKITRVTAHLSEHGHDDHTRVGLLKLVGKRRRILRYLRSKDEVRYKNLIKKLGIRG